MEGRASKRKNINHIIDVLMVMFLPMLMAYSLIGETFHEIVGTVMLLLFLLHQILHLKWWKAVFKGRYTAYRICITTINIVLLVMMFMQPLSGIAVSKHIYTFLPLTGLAAQARSIHMALAYWCYVLMSFHLGLHLDLMVTAANRKLKSAATVKWIIRSIVWAVSAYGIYAFIHRGFPGYMFLQTLFAYFDYAEPMAAFFADYLAIMVLFAAGGYYTGRLLKKGCFKEANSK